MCDYVFPSERFKGKRGIYPLFKRDIPNLAKRIIPNLRKLYNKKMILNQKEELLQVLDGYVRASHIQAIKGEFEIATVINEATIKFINQILQQEKFLDWIGNDKEIFDELERISSNALKLKDYLLDKQKTEEKSPKQ